MLSLRNLQTPMFRLYSSGGSLSQGEVIPVESVTFMEIETTTIPPNNTLSSKTPYIDIPEINIKEASNHTDMWSAEEWAIRNARIARHEPWGQQTEQRNPWDYNIKIVPDEERRSFLSAAVTTRL